MALGHFLFGNLMRLRDESPLPTSPNDSPSTSATTTNNTTLSESTYSSFNSSSTSILDKSTTNTDTTPPESSSSTSASISSSSSFAASIESPTTTSVAETRLVDQSPTATKRRHHTVNSNTSENFATTIVKTTSPPFAGPTSVSAAPSSGITHGTMAGISVGAGLAGALIATLVVFFCMRRRRRALRRDGRTRIPSGLGLDVGGLEKPSKSTTTLLPTGSNTHRDLPQAEDDGSLASGLSTLATVIKNHASSFFSDTTSYDLPQLSYDAVQSLQVLLHPAAPLQAEELLEMLMYPRSRPVAVRSILASAILRCIDPTAGGGQTLLPPALAECMQTLQSRPAKSFASDLPVRTWRQLTGEILRPTYGSKALPANDPRQAHISQLASDLNSILQNYTSSDAHIREQNLVEVIKKGAHVGFMLFSQPSDWAFEWEDSRTERDRGLVVFPALLQVWEEEESRRSRTVQPSTKQTVPLWIPRDGGGGRS